MTSTTNAGTGVDELEKIGPALDKGLDILELLAAQESALSQGEIARALDRTPNEIIGCSIVSFAARTCAEPATTDMSSR